MSMACLKVREILVGDDATWRNLPGFPDEITTRFVPFNLVISVFQELLQRRADRFICLDDINPHSYASTASLSFNSKRPRRGT